MIQENYWQHKLSVFLHDPAHKALSIQRHEELAQDIATLLHQSAPQKAEYSAADRIASSLSRAALPGYCKDEMQNGAVDFTPNPVLTHPLVNGATLSTVLGNVDVNTVHDAIRAVLIKDVGLGLSAEELNFIRSTPGATAPLSAYFSYSNDPEGWSRALFHYLFFAFKKRLRAQNVGGIGALWDLMPADTRMPDHPLWHHCGLTSAIASSMKFDSNNHVGVAVFSITPVQSFITKARKLRDHWVGSVILSYLAFVGIRHISRTLGPDHVLYPSLHDQSLVELWLAQEFYLNDFLQEPDLHARKHLENSSAIASFPNKFVFTGPNSQMEQICQGIRDAIHKEWLHLALLVRDLLAPRSDGRKMRELFDHQVSDYWQFRDASMRLVGLGDTQDLLTILHPDKWHDEQETVKDFSSVFPSGDTFARLYSATHSAVQSLLASSKLKPEMPRKAQGGEKCPLCGEHEVLHDFVLAGSTKAKEYKNGVLAFWDNLRERMNSEGSFAQVGKNERLCAVCCIKRFLPLSLKKHPSELLYSVLAQEESFPSTTEISAHSYMEQLNIPKDERRFLANKFHNAEIDDSDDDIVLPERDKYYAMLVMDGDKMGDLINGKTLTATWGDVVHPILRKRFDQLGFVKDSPLKKRMKEKRTLNPALHSTISDSLNSFGRFAVAPLIHNASGRLIYAGGDDVCAVVPLDTALKTADNIQRAYTMDFVRYAEHGPEALTGTINDLKGKWGIHLGGNGQVKGISISGALVLAHHKTPLREVLRDAQRLLSAEAKENAGRNALAISLSKRSGAPRKMTLRWEDENVFMDNSERILESFQAVMLDVDNDDLASRLLYSLESLHDALHPMMKTDSEVEKNKDKIVRLFRYEILHSGKMVMGNKEEQKVAADIMARRLVGICLQKRHDDNMWVFHPEAAIIARFLAPRTIRGNK